MQDELVDPRAEMRREFAALLEEVRSDIRADFDRLLLILLAGMAAFVTVVLVVSRLA